MTAGAEGKRGPGRGVKRRRPPRAKVIYADSERDADMLYATGVQVPDPFLFVRHRGKTHVVVSDLEYGRVCREGRVDRVLSTREVLERGRRGAKGGGTAADICASTLRLLGISRIEVPHSFPLGLADALRRRRIVVEPGSQPFFPERAVKGPEEVAHLRDALRATQRGMRVAADVLREARIAPGKGEALLLGGTPLAAARLRNLIQKALLDRGYLARNTIVACGSQGYDPHERGKGTLRANRPIIVDIFPRSERTGYHGDMTRTFVKGRASERVRAMYEAVRKAQAAAIAAIRPGVGGEKVHEKVQQTLERLGFSTERRGDRVVGFFHGTGHGLGLDIHEHPSVGPRPCRLIRGNVVTVEPGLYYPDVGGVRLEDVVWIREEGSTLLSRFPKDLEIGA